MTVAKPNTFTADTTILSASVNANFDALFTTLGLSDYDAQHNANGTHGAITGDSLTVTGNIVTSGGNLSVNGTSTFTGNAIASGTFTVTGATTLNGAVTLGDATGDDITVTGRLASSIVPKTDNSVDLGSATNEFKDLYIDGTANIDNLVADAVTAATTDAVFANVDNANADSLVAVMDAANANDIREKTTRSTGTSVPAGGIAFSSGTGDTDTYTSSSFTDVTGMSLTITTNGKPVILKFVPKTGAVSKSHLTFAGGTQILKIVRDSTDIVSFNENSSGTAFRRPPGNFVYIDQVAAGTYTYKVQAANFGTTVNFENIRLVAYEL